MEVMRVVLLCALALLPGLAKQAFRRRTFNYIEAKPNSTLLMQLNPFPPHKLILNMPNPAYLQTSKLQAVFQDIKCHYCINCMERAIRAHKYHQKASLRRSYSDELQNELLTNQIGHRSKRETNSNNGTEEVVTKKEKRSKSKRSKVHKAVTVTKYNVDGQVSALKVKETSAPNIDNSGKPPVETCEVYSIKKSFPCDSPEGDLMVKLAKRKTSKKETRVKKETDKSLAPKINTDKEKTASVYRKREIDNSQVPENVMSSLEEFY